MRNVQIRCRSFLLSVGTITTEYGASPWPHEYRTAQALIAIGYSITFIRKSDKEFEHSADAMIDGVIWEMKAPKGPGAKSIERNLRKAVKQSGYIIFDSRRLKGIPDAAVERELRACCEKRVKGITRLLFVNRHGKVIEIK